MLITVNIYILALKQETYVNGNFCTLKKEIALPLTSAGLSASGGTKLLTFTPASLAISLRIELLWP